MVNSLYRLLQCTPTWEGGVIPDDVVVFPVINGRVGDGAGSYRAEHERRVENFHMCCARTGIRALENVRLYRITRTKVGYAIINPRPFEGCDGLIDAVDFDIGHEIGRISRCLGIV